MDGTINEILIETDIVSLQLAMESGALSSVTCVRWYLERIERLNPKLRAVLEVNPDAMAIAEALDAERRERGSRGPLHGIPILLKDNIDTGDRMHTSAGSVALAEHFAQKDSALAAQLRAAGTVFLGKANMTEWANFMSNKMWAGYSSRGGLTLNPYGPDQGIDHVIREHRLDALLFLGNEEGLDLSARAGYPAITVPGGYAETGIIAEGGYTTKGPQGITFVGTAYSEPSLFRLAYAYEQASKYRFAPTDPV
jgi:Asp-tRNA(Asn)/Glu-tRNA(Gln) amidotransferase A subunit family amidase